MLDSLGSVIDGIGEVDFEFVSDDELEDGVAAFSRAVSRLEAVTARWAGEAKRRGSFERHGLVSLTRWLACHADIDHGRARALVALGNTMERPPRPPGHWSSSGEVSGTRARVLSRAAQAHPKLYERDEAMLVGFAREQTLGDLHRSVRLLAALRRRHHRRTVRGQATGSGVSERVGDLGGDGAPRRAAGPHHRRCGAGRAGCRHPGHRVAGDDRAGGEPTAPRRSGRSASNGYATAPSTAASAPRSPSPSTSTPWKAATGSTVSSTTPGRSLAETARRILCDADVTPGDHRGATPRSSTWAAPPAPRHRRSARRSTCATGTAGSGAATAPRTAATRITSSTGYEAATTCLDNLILLCRHHHSLLHEGKAYVCGTDVLPVTEDRPPDRDPPLHPTREPVTAGTLRQ